MSGARFRHGPGRKSRHGLSGNDRAVDAKRVAITGVSRLGVDEVPPAGQAILHDIGYEMHAGVHSMVPSD